MARAIIINIIIIIIYLVHSYTTTFVEIADATNLLSTLLYSEPLPSNHPLSLDNQRSSDHV